MARPEPRRTPGRHGRALPLATTAAIRALAQAIAARFQPKRVMLFGSYANGTAGPDSDVDLLVVMETPLSTIQQAARISQAVEHRFPLDILVRTPQQVTEGIQSGDLFLREVMTSGVTLYEARDPGLD